MAELVHKHIEEMLPELEQMQRVKLFSSREIKAIIKKRTAHEYKLVRRTKLKKDFLAYVQYEINVLNLIHNRRLREKYFFKKDEIEYAIVGRIHRLFKRMTVQWAHDLKIWMSHAKFCVKWSKKIQLSKLCTRFLQMHGNKPELWILAAKWEIECCNSMDKGRLIFMKAVKLHTNNKKIWLEFFRSELLYADKLQRRLKVLDAAADIVDLDTSEGKLLNGDAARIAYRNALLAIPNDVEFHTKFLHVITCFLSTSSFAQNIMEEIKQNLSKLHHDDPIARSALAQLHLNPCCASGDPNNKDLDQLKREEKCWQAFDKAVVDIDTEDMWACYVDCLLALCEENIASTMVLGSSEATVSHNRLNQAFNIINKAHDKQKLNAAKYEKLTEFFLKHGRIREAYKMVDQMCKDQTLPSLLLKRIELLLLISTENPQNFSISKVNELFCVTKVHTDFMTTAQQELFWLLWMKYAILHKDEEMAKNVALRFSLGIKNLVTSKMHDLYLQWIALHHGVVTAYKVFQEELCSVFTPPYDRYKAMLALLQTSPKATDALERCFELTLRDYGDDYPELWLNYAKYCQQQGGAKAAKIGNLYWRAKKTLKPVHIDRFITGFALIGSNTQ